MSQGAAKVSNALRRSSRAKFAPIQLVLSGGNSKTYGPPTAISISRAAEVAKPSLKDVAEGPTEIGKEEKPAPHASNPLKNSETIENHKNVSQESSEDDHASLLSSDQHSSMMVTRLKRSKSPSTTSEMVRPKRGKGAADLDEPTMTAFKEFLRRHKFDSLDEDELIRDTLTILKAAGEKYRTILLELHSDTYGSDDDSIFEKCLQVEENHAIGQDFLREIVAGIAQTTSGPAKKINATAVHQSDMNKVLVDQKTVGWIRRATGLHRNKSNAELTNTFSAIRQENKSETSSRIATRRVLNDGGASYKKRYRGLDLLADAIVELEKDFGTHFPVYRFRSSPPKKKKPRHTCDGNKKIRRKMDGKQRSARKKARHHKMKRPSPRICTALRVLDETWHLQTKSNLFLGHVNETEDEYLNRLSVPLHPQFVKAGIIYRLPTVQSLLNNHSLNVLTKSFAPQANPSPIDEDTLDDKLTSLEGPPAQFAKCEFFYGDLDIDWYEISSDETFVHYITDNRSLLIFKVSR